MMADNTVQRGPVFKRSSRFRQEDGSLPTPPSTVARCSFCQTKDSLRTPLIVVPDVQGGIAVAVKACRSCAHRYGLVCLKHNEAHQAYADGSYACLSCIEEDVRIESRDCTLLEQIRGCLPSDRWNEFLSAAHLFKVDGESTEIALFRMLVTSGKRKRMRLDRIAFEVCKAQSIEPIDLKEPLVPFGGYP